MRLRLDILPPAQRRFLDEVAPLVPSHFVLYGGTAIALRFGHRRSVDFDFFTSRAVDEAALRRSIAPLRRATVLQREEQTRSFSLSFPEGEVQLSLFGKLRFGRVGEPERFAGKITLAAPIDLLATKLGVLTQCVEARDYVDIEVLLREGHTLQQGLAAAAALHGSMFSPVDTAKALAWFADGDLERKLPAATREFLTRAATRIDPDMAPARRRSRALAA